MDWFTTLARHLDVQFVKGSVLGLHRDGGSIYGALIEDESEPSNANNRRYILRADSYVLAGGSPGGRMFLSTNACIDHSPQELAYRAGFELTDASLFMFHILGNCTVDGSPRTGCLETDLLAGGRVYLHDATGQHCAFDPETTELLAAHQAHYHFPEVARRFLNHGGVAKIAMPDGTERRGRVSHHYSHLCVATTDGVSVRGSANLLAVGDAAGTGHWSGHRVRYPGTALAGCLVTAKLAQQHVTRAGRGPRPATWEQVDASGPHRADRRMLRRQENRLRVLNTENLMAYQFGNNKRVDSTRWLCQLRNQSPGAVVAARDLFELSVLTASACRRVSEDAEAEPLRWDRSTVAEILNRRPQSGMPGATRSTPGRGIVRRLQSSTG